MRHIRQIIFIGVMIFGAIENLHAERSLRVGLALPLSGVGAPWGEAYKNGLMLGLDQARDKIELKIEDHQYDNKSTLFAARKLAQVDDVDLLCIWGYAPSDVVAPIVPSLKIPVLLGSLNPVGKQQPAIFNLALPLEKSLSPLLHYLGTRNDLQLAIVAAQIGSQEQSAHFIEANLLPDRIDRLEVVLAEQMDFRSIITKFKSSNVSLVGLFLTPAQIKVFVEQMRNLHYTPNLFGGDTLNDSSIYPLFSDTEEGPVFVDAFSDPEFSKNYTRKFKSSSHVVEAARGKLLASLLIHISQNIDSSYTPEAITKALQSFPKGDGPAGSYRVVFDEEFGWYLLVEPVLYHISSGEIRRFESGSGNDTINLVG